MAIFKGVTAVYLRCCFRVARAIMGQKSSKGAQHRARIHRLSRVLPIFHVHVCPSTDEQLHNVQMATANSCMQGTADFADIFGITVAARGDVGQRQNVQAKMQIHHRRNVAR
jgi:hypothetical protein